MGPGREGPWQAQWEMSLVVTIHGSQMHVGEALKFRVLLVGSTNTYQFGYYVEMRNSFASRKYVSMMKLWPPGYLLDTLRCSSEWELPPGVWRRVIEPLTSYHSSPVFDGSPCHLWHTWSGQAASVRRAPLSGHRYLGCDNWEGLQPEPCGAEQARGCLTPGLIHSSTIYCHVPGTVVGTGDTADKNPFPLQEGKLTKSQTDK